MKKMKLFVTVSVLCLGIAAVANTQAHRFATIDGYKADALNRCLTKVANACSDQTGTDCVVGGAQLYLQNTGACTTPIAKIP
jgi:hypothetical protein